jgi:outer membrane protein assembly factor BamB
MKEERSPALAGVKTGATTMSANRTAGVLAGCVMLLGVRGACAQDWPQWRGPNRDAKAHGFQAPTAWPKELTRKWKAKVGEGVASPALVGDKLYVFTREGGDEVTRCLDAATGAELWRDSYPAPAVRGPAARFPGPRSSPAVADGKVVTLGVGGTLSCLDAAGKKLWRKDDFKGSLPRFYMASSPLLVGGLCVAQLGGESRGGVVAYDLATGEERWKWSGDGTAYASPVLAAVGGAQEVVAETAGNIVGLGLADGKLLWKTPFRVRYNACTPVVDGATVIYSGAGGGTHAVQVEGQGGGLAAKELWSNKDIAVQFNTPVLRDGLLFGISANNELFCVNARDGKTAWTEPAPGGGRSRGYGSVVDAGPVLLALTPAAQLTAFEPSDRGFKQVASYKVADSDTYAYPVVAGNRVFVKDRDALILWAIE